jgi:hypothetical protein
VPAAFGTARFRFPPLVLLASSVRSLPLLLRHPRHCCGLPGSPARQTASYPLPSFAPNLATPPQPRPSLCLWLGGALLHRLALHLRLICFSFINSRERGASHEDLLRVYTRHLFIIPPLTSVLRPRLNYFPVPLRFSEGLTPSFVRQSCF